MSAQEPIMSAQEPIAKPSTTASSEISAMPESNCRSAIVPASEPIVKSAVILFAIFTVLTGLVYPCLITFVAQAVFPRQAEGSLIRSPLERLSKAVASNKVQNGVNNEVNSSTNHDANHNANHDVNHDVVVGSSLVGQSFTEPRYFWPRPSATSPAYNAAASSGSNLGPTNPDFLATVSKRADALRAISKGQPSPGSTRLEKVPVDLVTASASGLDPDISPAAARVQVERVANARSISREQVLKLVAEHTKGRDFGVLGDHRVNVLELNLALDQLNQKM